MLDRTLRAAARFWYAQMLQEAPSTPSPRDTPRVRAGVGPADRVLLLGNGVLHGWGVPLRGLAVQGHLAELVQARTGRAVVVDHIGEERMNAASALHWLGGAAGRGHDVAVIAIGLNDALRLTPLSDWQAQMRDLLTRVVEAQDERARVLLVGLPHVRAFAMADSALGSVAQRHADRMDQVLRDLAAVHDGVTYVEAPREHFEADRPLGSSSMYRSWAEQLLPALLAALQAVRAQKPVAAEGAKKWDWIGTPTALSADGSAVQQRLDTLTEAVRKRYGVVMAGINVLDGEDVYSIAGRGGGPRQMPRSLAYCHRTVDRNAPTMIEDAEKDPEFAGNPFLDVVGLPFYVGVPLHASDGRPVATLCVLDSEPRHDIDPGDLLGFAALAEGELRAFESPTGADRGVPASIVAPAALSGPAPTAAAAGREVLALRAAALLLRPVILLALRGFLKRQARPHWDNRTLIEGPDPLRVLIFGAGLAVGYGADGADDPLSSEIATAFADITGRGVLVEIRARPSIPLEQSLTLLGPTGAATFDHVIWSPTLEEAARGSQRRWTAALGRIVRTVQSTGPSHMQMTLLGLPLVDGEHPLQRIGRVLGDEVNRRIEAAAAADARAQYLPVPSRTVPDSETPLFDPAYRSEVAALVGRHLSGNRVQVRAVVAG